MIVDLFDKPYGEMTEAITDGNRALSESERSK